MADIQELLFVYGTLQPGLAPASVADIVAGPNLGPATMPGRMYDLSAYPGATYDPAADTFVHGVVVTLPDPTPWERLDRYEGYSLTDPRASLFVRQQATVTLADGTKRHAWVYTYNRNTGERQRIVSGKYEPNRTKRRPVIGITLDSRDEADRSSPLSYYQLAFTYAQAVEQAGGLPMAIPYRTHHALIPQFVDMLDGILFTGGDDLDPAAYGENLHPRAVPIDARRQAFEMALLAEVERRRLPGLFVCCGMQVLNVFRGGSLIQFLPDLPGRLEHRRLDAPSRRHDVTIVADSVLGRCIGQTVISVNTYHKQAVKKLGRGLKITASAPDGTVEAMEDPSFPLMLAVQWHPERLSDETEHLAPFKLLVEKANES